eukprot:366457-Chlamydomonas_euryale.AAC.4
MHERLDRHNKGFMRHPRPHAAGEVGRGLPCNARMMRACSGGVEVMRAHSGGGGGLGDARTTVHHSKTTYGHSRARRGKASCAVRQRVGSGGKTWHATLQRCVETEGEELGQDVACYAGTMCGHERKRDMAGPGVSCWKNMWTWG